MHPIWQHRFFNCNNYKPLDPEDQLSLAKEKNLWFNCLKSDHWPQSYKSANSCFQQDCSRKHHTTLHDAIEIKSANENQTNQNITLGMSTQESNEVHLQIVPVLISSLNGKSQKICALFDTLSQSTLIKLCSRTQATWKQNQN